MGFELKNIVPWGRNTAEYRSFFQLTDADLDRSILSCADGPASFNAEMTALGKNCVSIDPIYAFTKEEIAQRIDETADEIYSQLLKNQSDYKWDYYQTPEILLETRLQAMKLFLTDFEQGKLAGRYVAGLLPEISLPQQQFELVLCSHFLFTYADHLSIDFHIRSIIEMLKKGKEIRIFPVCKLDGSPSSHLEYILEYLKKSKIAFDLVKTEYEFQKGGNIMLKI